MTAVYPTQTITEFYNGSNWIDISAYVVEDIKGVSGFSSNNPTNRMAGLGTLDLELNNVSNLFTVYGNDAARGLSTLTGWKRGAKIRVRTIVGGKSKPIWTGRIADIVSDDGTWGTRQAHVKCVDYIDILTRYSMKSTDILINQTVDSAATALLSLLPIQPEATLFDAGLETFPAVFSNIGEKTKALGELNKLMLSELGYGCILKDGTFRIENKNARNGMRELDQVGTYPPDRNQLKLLSGDTFKLLSGDTLALESPVAAGLTYTPEKLSLTMDDSQDINGVSCKAYPVRIDTSLVVVFNLGNAMALAGGATVTFTGKYTNPSGGGSISATNQQTPVSVTDYKMYANSDGTGTDLTSNLTVTAEYHGDRVNYTLHNSGSQVGYVTLLQARGFGIYFDSAIESTVEDADIINTYGNYEVVLDQRYKRDFYRGVAYAKTLLEFNKTPRTRVLKASFNANISSSQLMSCLDLDIGSLVSINDNKSNITRWYYIYSRSFVISAGGVIDFVFGCSEAVSSLSGDLNEVAIEFTGNTSSYINFGYVPEISNLPQRSYALWFHSGTITSGFNIFSTLGNGAGVSLYSGGSKNLVFSKANTLYGINPEWVWFLNNNVLTDNTLHLIVVTHDASINPGTDPIFYINGSVQSIAARTLSGTNAADETGTEFKIGDPQGKLQYLMIFNRILSATETTTLYNSGSPDDTLITDGLVFNGFTIDAGLGTAASLNGSQIPAGHNYIDKIYSSIGTPSGTPLIRVPE